MRNRAKTRTNTGIYAGPDAETFAWLASNGRALADQMFRDTVRVIEDEEQLGVPNHTASAQNAPPRRSKD